MIAVFRKAFRDSRRTVLWVSVGLAAYALFIMAFFPTIYDRQEDFAELLDAYPQEIMSMISGGMDMTDFNLADPASFLQVYLGVYVVLILGALVMVQAFNALTNAERDGTMDLTLSLPVSRRDMLLGRLANTAVGVLIALTVLFIFVAAASQVVEGFDINLGRTAVAIYTMFLIIMAQACFTYMLASIVPSSKRWAGAVAYALFFGSYLIVSFSSSIESLRDFMPLFIFDHYQLAEIVRQGLKLGDVIFLAAVALITAGIAWWQIDRKEMGV